MKEKGYGYVKVKVKRQKISREDSAGWMIELFRMNIVVQNIFTSQELIMSQVQIKEELQKLHKRGFLSWLLNTNLFKGIL